MIDRLEELLRMAAAEKDEEQRPDGEDVLLPAGAAVAAAPAERAATEDAPPETETEGREGLPAGQMRTEAGDAEGWARRTALDLTVPVSVSAQEQAGASRQRNVEAPGNISVPVDAAVPMDVLELTGTGTSVNASILAAILARRGVSGLENALTPAEGVAPVEKTVPAEGTVLRDALTAVGAADSVEGAALTGALGADAADPVEGAVLAGRRLSADTWAVGPGSALIDAGGGARLIPEELGGLAELAAAVRGQMTLSVRTPNRGNTWRSGEMDGPEALSLLADGQGGKRELRRTAEPESGLEWLYRETTREVSPTEAVSAAGTPAGETASERSSPVARGLTVEELDRAVCRDSRRYDGGMTIY